MSQGLIVREFLDEVTQRADNSFKGRLHQAFLSWYIDAEFGRVAWDFTDDVSDGGIDAVVWRPDDLPPVVIIQSKFTEIVGSGQTPARAYRDFRSVVDAFHYRDEAFDEFLADVRDDLKRIYRRAFDRLTDLNNWRLEQKAFRLVTTMRRRPRSEFNRIPKENFVYAVDVLRLYEQFRKGATPKPRPLQLTIEDKLVYSDRRRGVTSYLFNARLSDFRRYLAHNDVARLVARNIRYNLGGQVSREIKKTYERAPLDFWYFHNGLTIVCDDLVEKNRVATLINPSVVNGAQTLYAISGSRRQQSPALVPTRVVVRGDSGSGDIEDDQWIQAIIRGVNTQNRVRSYDFRSNEPEQVELQNKLRDLGIFYERKRGEWGEYRNEPRYRGFDKVSLKTMGQVLAATSDRSGQGVLLVKRGVDFIFDGKSYRALFPPRTKIRRRVKKIYVAYRIYRLLDRFGYRSAREHRKQRHGFWNTLWLLHRGVAPRIDGRASLRALRATFDEFEGRRAWGRRARKVVRQARSAVWSSWRVARKVDPERWTANNFFKSKFGNTKILRIAYPKVRPQVETLGKHLARTR